MGVRYLSASQVLELHRLSIDEFGGNHGLRSEAQFPSALFQPQQSAFGEDTYPTVHEKSAAYGFFIAESQAFLDGNKRTAAAAMLVFLDANGYRLNCDDDELADAIEGLGERRLDQANFFSWVGERVIVRSREPEE